MFRNKFSEPRPEELFGGQSGNEESEQSAVRSQDFRREKDEAKICRSSGGMKHFKLYFSLNVNV